MQEKKTSLRGDRDSDLIIEFETAAAFEMFLIEEHLNVPEKFHLIRARKSPKDRDVTRDNGFPCCGKWPGAQALATPMPEGCKDHIDIVANDAKDFP